MVHPNVNLEQPPTALFVPLGLTQAMHDSLPVSEGPCPARSGSNF